MESLFHECFNILTIFQAEVEGEEYNITYGIITLFNFNLRLKWCGQEPPFTKYGMITFSSRKGIEIPTGKQDQSLGISQKTNILINF